MIDNTMRMENMRKNTEVIITTERADISLLLFCGFSTMVEGSEKDVGLMVSAVCSVMKDL